MRRLLIVLGLVGLTSNAFADEFELPTLRGSDPFFPAAPVYTNWGGFYAGGQIGYGSANMDFSGATKPLIALMLQQLALENPTQVNPPVSQWTVLGKADSQRPTYGGFFGYNSQWDNVVIGFDFQFNSSKFAADAPSTPIARVVSAGGNAYDVTVTGAASMKIDDYGSLRTRAGYVMNNVMPYVAFGVAFGLADVMRSATVTGMENPSSPPDPTTCGTASAPNCVPFAFTKTESKKNALIWGWSAGAGLDFLVLPNVFVRAEYEYTSFASLYGIKATINSGRIGAGYRF